MNNPFTIHQRLYIDRTSCSSDLIAALSCLKSASIQSTSEHQSIVIALSDESAITIKDQFLFYKNELTKIVKLLLSFNYKGEVLLQVYVKAYEYMPEIGFPNQLVRLLAEISAEIDVDVNDMVEQ